MSKHDVTFKNPFEDAMIIEITTLQELVADDYFARIREWRRHHWLLRWRYKKPQEPDWDNIEHVEYKKEIRSLKP